MKIEINVNKTDNEKYNLMLCIFINKSDVFLADALFLSY
jgi:hypothetical protein